MTKVEFINQAGFDCSFNIDHVLDEMKKQLNIDYYFDQLTNIIEFRI